MQSDDMAHQTFIFELLSRQYSSKIIGFLNSIFDNYAYELYPMYEKLLHLKKKFDFLTSDFQGMAEKSRHIRPSFHNLLYVVLSNDKKETRLIILVVPFFMTNT